MIQEIEFMRKNTVLKLVDLPLGYKTIGKKWVPKIKRQVDGLIKMCLMVKGYPQRECVRYEETFSPVVSFALIHLILVLITHLDLELC